MSKFKRIVPKTVQERVDVAEARAADLDEAVALLRSLARRDTCPSCGARDGEACPTDCELTAFLSRHPAPEVGS